MIKVTDNKSLREFVLYRCKQLNIKRKELTPKIAKICNVVDTTVNGYLLVSNPTNLSDRNAKKIQLAIEQGKL